MFNSYNISKTIKFNLLGLIKLEFNASGLATWVIVATGVALALFNVLIISGLGFWAIETLFKFSIPFTATNILAGIILAMIVRGTGD